MAQPRAAVVIPAFGAPEDLERTLARVAGQASQVVVAVDGPSPALAAVAAAHGATVVQLPTNQGSYAARNAGVDALLPDIEIVAFTDMDCLPDDGWIAAHARALQSAELSGGAIEVTTTSRPSPSEVVDAHRHLRQESYVLEEGYAATANLAVRRSILEQLRFDSSLRSGGDNDFGARSRALGLSLVYTSDAVVRHPARTSSSAVKHKVARIVEGIEANPERWKVRPVPPPPLRPGWLRTAAKGRGPIWLARAYWLQQSCDWQIHRSVTKIRDEQFKAVQGRLAVVARYPEQTVDAEAVVAITQTPGAGQGIPAHFLSVDPSKDTVASVVRQLKKSAISEITTDGSAEAEQLAKALRRRLKVG